jgi:O-antigen/teichoic acid export membrane protein
MLAILIARGAYSFVPDFKFLKRPLLKKIGHVGLFGLVSSFSGVMVLNIDILMLNHFEGLAQTGIYTITFFFGALVLIPSRSMAKISSVIISDAFKRKDLDEVNRIYKKSSINLGIVGVLVFIGLWANSDNIFQLIGEDFRPGYLVIMFIGLANLFDMFSGISSQIFFNSKYYTISAYLSFSYMVVLIVSNLIFIPYYGIIGAAVATLISKFLYNAFKYVFLLKKFRFQPFNFKSLLLIVLGLSTMFLIQFLPNMTNYIVDIGLRSLIIVIVFSLGVYFLKLSDDINIWVDKIWKVYLKSKF